MNILSSLTSSALNQLSSLVDQKESLLKEIERIESHKGHYRLQAK